MESLGAAMPGVGFLLGGAIVALGSPRAAYAIAGARPAARARRAPLPLRARLRPQRGHSRSAARRDAPGPLRHPAHRRGRRRADDPA